MFLIKYNTPQLFNSNLDRKALHRYVKMLLIKYNNLKPDVAIQITLPCFSATNSHMRQSVSKLITLY